MIKYLLLLLTLLYSCSHTYTDKKSGKQYQLIYHCIDGHYENQTSYYYINNVMYPTITTFFICDKGYYDTLFIK